jgi:hypothetical protein
MTKIWPTFWPALAFVVATTAALAVRAVLLVALRRWPASGSASVVAAAIRGPSLLWCLALGLYLGNDVALDLSLLPGIWHARVGTLLRPSSCYR